MPTLRLLALAALCIAMPVAAQDVTDPPAALALSGGVTLASDYRWRGVSLSDEDVAIQPELTLEHESGLYATLWGSNVADSPLTGAVEVDFTAGYAREIAPGLTLDAGLTYYWYPDGSGASDYAEPHASLSGTLGPATAEVGVAYAWSQAALGNADSLYLYGDLSVGVPTTPLTLNARLGRSEGALGYGGGYWDWSLGVDYVLAPATLGLRYVDSDLDRLTGAPAIDTQYDATLLAELRLSF